MVNLSPAETVGDQVMLVSEVWLGMSVLMTSAVLPGAVILG